MESLSFIATYAQGELHGDNVLFTGVSTDTRTLAKGDVFFALSGPRFDGHQFCAAAEAAGAAGLVVSEKVDNELPQVIVKDVREALGMTAAAWRQRFNIPVIAVTGSSGKTAVKQMIASIMRQRGPVLATQGNLNNEIGVPLTLLQLRDNHQCAVIEMGANHRGEIALLANYARPNIGLVNNAGEAHLEGFGGIEGVVQGKGELYSGVIDGGVCVINTDQLWHEEWQALAGVKRKVLVGSRPGNDFWYSDLVEAPEQQQFTLHTPDGDVAIVLNLPGRHSVMNATAAAAAAWSAGATPENIADGLSAARNVAGRMQFEKLRGDITVVDDTYNANPLSTRAAIDWLVSNADQPWLVLGDMGELGEDSLVLHEEIGRYAAERGVVRFYSLGSLARKAAKAFGEDAKHFDSIDDLNEQLQKDLRAGVTLLVKGSRSARMERVVTALRAGGES